MPFPNPDTQFKPGQSGNPKGRPRRPDVEALDRLIAEMEAEGGLAKVWLENALGDGSKGIKPDFAFFKLLVEHRNGQPPRDDKLTAEHGGSVEIRVSYDHGAGADDRDPAPEAPPGPADGPAE